MGIQESKRFAVRAELMKRGMSLADWGRENGVHPKSVSVLLIRWAGKKERPRGKETIRVISLLEDFIGFKICGR